MTITCILYHITRSNKRRKAATTYCVQILCMFCSQLSFCRLTCCDLLCTSEWMLKWHTKILSPRRQFKNVILTVSRCMPAGYPRPNRQFSLFICCCGPESFQSESKQTCISKLICRCFCYFLATLSSSSSWSWSSTWITTRTLHTIIYYEVWMEI